MKYSKYIYAGMAALALAACTSDELDVQGGEQPGTPAAETQQQPERGTMTGVRADQLIDEGELDMDTGEDSPAAATRMSLDSQGAQHWQKGDRISVSDGTHYAPYEAETVHANGSCSFTSVGKDKDGNTVHLLDGVAEGTTFYALYPELSVSGAGERGGWKLAENDGVDVSAMVFVEQDYAENMGTGDQPGQFGAYMVAEAKVETKNEEKTVEFDFHTLTSIIDVNLKSLGLPEGHYPLSVSVKSNNGACIAGKVTYNFKDGKAYVSATDKTKYSANSQSDMIKVGNLPTSGVETVRFYVLPVTLEGGITVSVETSNGYSIAKSTTTTVGGKNSATYAFEGIQNYDGKTSQCCHPYYKKLNFGAWDATGARQGDWMSGLPSDIYYSLLSIPGAHQAGSHGFTDVAKKCQTMSITDLLLGGCRALDFRVGLTSGGMLHLSHGDSDTGIWIYTAIADVQTFLTNHPTEAVFVRIHREEPTRGYTQREQTDWGHKMYNVIADSRWGNMMLRELLPTTTLQDCRGKMVILSCDEMYYAYKESYYGAKADLFPNSAATIYAVNHADKDENDLRLTYQDIYQLGGGGSLTGVPCLEAYRNIYQWGGVSSHRAKADLVKKVIDEATESGGLGETNNQRLFLNYCNWEGAPGSSVGDNCKLIMSEVNAHIGGEHGKHGRLGIMMADHVLDADCGGKDFVAKVVQQNFHYVFNGRSRILHGDETAELPNSCGLLLHPSEPADSSQNFAPAWRH